MQKLRATLLKIAPSIKQLCMVATMTVLLAGCTGTAKKNLARNHITASPQAEETYRFLVYQDLAGSLNKAVQVPGSMTPEEIETLRLRTLTALEQVMETSQSAQLYRDKASLLWAEEKFGRKARPTLHQGLKKYPGDRIMTMYLVNSWLMEGKTAKASEIMTEYLKAQPKDLEARERYGQLLVEAGQYADGLDQLNFVPKSKSTVETYYYKSRALTKLGDHEKAIENLKQALKRYPEFMEGLAELAYLYELTRQYTMASKTYEQLLAMDGGPEVRLQLIGINIKLNNVDKALALSMDGPKTKAFILDATSNFIAADFYAQASTVLDVLTSLDPVPTEYWFYRSVIAYEGESDSEKALSALSKVTKETRHYPQALQFKAQILNTMGRQQEALDSLEEGLTLFPEQSRFYILKASLLAGMEKKDQAIRVLESGLAKKQADPTLTHELAVLLDNMGRRTEAMERMEALLTAHPDNSEALNFVGYTLAEEGKDLDRALVLVTNAARLDPGNGYIIDSVAWVHFKRKEYDKAWESIREAVSIQGESPDIWEHYGDIALAVGKKAQAKQAYQKAVRHGGNSKKLKAKLEAL